MDDLEFRRRAYADPDCQDKAFIEFKNKSVENSRFVEELKRLDHNLQLAIQIKPPQDLLERIKLRQTLEQHQCRRKRFRHWSLVASLFIGISMLVLVFTGIDDRRENFTAQNLSEDILQHIHHELDHLQAQHNKSLKQVNALLSEFGGNLSQHIAQVNFLGSCDIANKKGVHMVVQGNAGPVTVMLLPEVRVSELQQFSGQRFKGLVMPSGKGSIAIVGEKSESLQRLKASLQDYMRWI